MFERPRCINCGTDQLVARLHRERGGPMVCARCSDGIVLEISRQRKTQEAIFSALGLDTLEVLRLDSGHPEPPQLSLELLDDVLSLVHPDNHPPEHAPLANSECVTRAMVELLALGQSVRSRPTSAAGWTSRERNVVSCRSQMRNQACNGQYRRIFYCR